ncbi:DNA repair protein recO [sediment metagenome]|uniref:DNA repair protein RecO n=1 Tax=sediment metagenome TaxID=749907 RepID=D9PK38_9ZZZZ
MAISRTETIVLNKWDFRETSLIVNFYTRQFGKISGLLKGIRTEPQKFASSLELFSYNEIILYKKDKTDLHLVTQADLKDNFDSIRTDISRISSASTIVELLNAVVPPEEQNEEIFNLALECFHELKSCEKPAKITTIFTIKILALAGFKPHLDSCVSCGARIEGGCKFSFALGGLLCPKCQAKDLKSRSIFRGTVATILHIERNDFKNTLNLGLNPQIKKELDMVLNSFLTYHLEKELKSQKVADHLEFLRPGLAAPLKIE